MNKNRFAALIHYRKLIVVLFTLLAARSFAQKPVIPADSIYTSVLKTWCNGLIAHQVKEGSDAGGIFCPSHQFVHGRCGDIVYPLITMYNITREKKYLEAADKVFNWSESHISQPDGSWTNESGGKNDWKGISCFSAIALGEALRHHGHLLDAVTKEKWMNRLRKGADYILYNITYETGDINYPMSSAASMAVCWKVLGDKKYLDRAKELAHFAIQHFTKNSLIWGEGVRGPNDTTPKGLRPIDIPYNIEESLPNLALYGLITENKEVLDMVTLSMQSHIRWMLPDGGLDAGWCSRQYKWNYFGSATSDGCMGGFALMSNRDERFNEAGLRNLLLRKSYTHDGLLYGGADFYSLKIPCCIHQTMTTAKGLATAIDAGMSSFKSVSLPSDTAYGLQEWEEAGVVQIAFGPWRASVTTNDIASSPKRGGHPMGGALSMLWHSQSGPLAVASMNDYALYEKTNMQIPKSDFGKACLTPRLEVKYNDTLYSNIYDSKADMRWVKKGDSLIVTVIGDLRNRKGEELPGGRSHFTIRYTFTPSRFQMATNSKADNIKLIFPVVAQSAEQTSFRSGEGFTIYKKSSQVQVSKNIDNKKRTSVPGKRSFSFVPGFEAMVTESRPDTNGNAFISLMVK